MGEIKFTYEASMFVMGNYLPGLLIVPASLHMTHAEMKIVF